MPNTGLPAKSAPPSAAVPRREDQPDRYAALKEFDEMYIVKDDDQQRLLQKLVPIKLLDEEWTQVFYDPDTNSEWILFRHHSERQGGGQPVLRQNPVPELLSEWIKICLSSENEDDILGLAWELSRDFERWPDVLDWLEKNSANLSTSHIRLFLNNLEIFHGSNRRSITGKNVNDIEDDCRYFSNLATRAKKMIGTA